MKKTKKKVVKKVKAPTYEASIKIFGKVYEATGATVVEAVENLKGVGKVGGMCVLSISHDGVKREKILNSRILFGLFTGSRIMHEMAIKNINSLFGDI